MKATNRIIKVNFTWALPEGLWTIRENGDRDWESDKALLEELGRKEYDRIHKIAHHGGWTGMWYCC